MLLDDFFHPTFLMSDSFDIVKYNQHFTYCSLCQKDITTLVAEAQKQMTQGTEITQIQLDSSRVSLVKVGKITELTGFMLVPVSSAKLQSKSDKYHSLTTALDEICDGLIIVKSNGEVEFINRQLKQLFPDISVHHLEGKPFSEVLGMLIHSGEVVLMDSPEASQKWMANKIFQNAPIHVEFKTLKGGFFRYQDQITPNGDRIGILTDESNYYQLNEQLELSFKQAQELSDAKSQFMAMMGHEIRTPLNVIIGLIDLCLHNPNPENVHNLQLTQKNAHRLLNLLNDVLDFTKFDADKVQLCLQKCDLRKLCEDIIESFSSQHQSDETWLSLYVDPRIEKYVQCDDTRLSQVLNNLISNALKFSRAKIKKVTLSVLLDTKASSSDNYRLRFSVWDNGLGISQEQQSRIFKGFMQGSNNTYRQFGGTGLGLSICQRICRLMGAKLNVQSEVGLGSEFWFDVELSLDSKKETISIMPLRESVCVMTNHRLFNENLRQYAQQIGITCVYVPFESMLETNSEQTYFLIDPTQVHDWTWQGITNELTKLKGEYAFLGNNESSGSEHPFIPCSPLKLNQLLGWINDEELGEDNDKFQPEEVSPVMARLEVLVVDDNPDNLYVMEQQFVALGVSGVFCSEPKQAIECFTSDNVNVVISDYQMPEISGAVLIDKLRDIERQLERQPIEMVILSADKSEQCIQACTLSGANDIQLKPLSFERLKALLLEQGMRLSDDLDANKDHSSSDRKIEDMPLASGQDSPHCSLHDRWVDLDVIYKYVGPLNPEQLTRFWAQTVENLKRHRAELSDVLEQDQWQKMGLVAHKIKSSAMYFGAHRLSQQCQDLEEMVTRDLNDNTSLAATCTDALECIEQTILFLEGEVI